MSLRDLQTAVNGIHYLVEQSFSLDDLDALSKRLINIDSILLRIDSPRANTLRADIACILDECIVKMETETEKKTEKKTETNSSENVYVDDANEMYIYVSGMLLFLCIIVLYIQVWNATLRMLRPRQI
jgi:hypothetical protein